MSEREKRSYSLRDFRAVTGEENEKFVEGHAAIFGQRADIGGCFYEMIDRGAFYDKNALRDVALFVNHNWDQIPLARSRRNNGNSTMTLTVDDIGLAFRAKLDVENNPDAKAVYSAVSRGDLNSMSFAFRVDAEEWQDLKSEKPTRRIKKIGRVFEVSAVAFPAYEGTDISARALSTLESAKKALDNANTRSLENDSTELELYKLKNKILGGF